MLSQNGLTPTELQRASIHKKNDATPWKRSFTIFLSCNRILSSLQQLFLIGMTPGPQNQMCKKYHLSLSSKIWQPYPAGITENLGKLPPQPMIISSGVIYKAPRCLKRWLSCHLSSNCIMTTDFLPLYNIFNAASFIQLLGHIQECENFQILAMILLPTESHTSLFQSTCHLSWELPGSRSTPVKM